MTPEPFSMTFFSPSLLWVVQRKKVTLFRSKKEQKMPPSRIELEIFALHISYKCDALPLRHRGRDELGTRVGFVDAGDIKQYMKEMRWKLLWDKSVSFLKRRPGQLRA